MKGNSERGKGRGGVQNVNTAVGVNDQICVCAFSFSNRCLSDCKPYVHLIDAEVVD